jgi:hypothetical protein
VRIIALFVRFRPTKARKANETATACPAGRFLGTAVLYVKAGRRATPCADTQ